MAQREAGAWWDCDHCGNTDLGQFHELPDGWGALTDDNVDKDLCHVCMDKIRKALDE